MAPTFPQPPESDPALDVAPGPAPEAALAPTPESEIAPESEPGLASEPGAPLATVPAPKRFARILTRLTGWLLRLSWRSTMGLLALLVVLACLAAAAALAGACALVLTAEKDVTLNSELLKYWPKWLWAIVLLRRHAWHYLAGAGVALFVVLPCALAILERLWFVGYRPRGSGR